MNESDEEADLNQLDGLILEDEIDGKLTINSKAQKHELKAT